MNIVVLTGGSTPERDVALAGAGPVVDALRSRGHTVVAVDTTSGALTQADEAELLHRPVPATPPAPDELARLASRELGPALVTLPAVRDADVLFPVLHGSDAEGGIMQAMLESAGIWYTGSGPLGSGLAMDKDIAKRLLRDAGIPTPAWCVWPAPDDAVGNLGLPLIVKPSKVGSTVGLTVVTDQKDIRAAVDQALQFDDEVLLEAFVAGPELTVGILDGTALAVGEIRPEHDIFDYECKYTPGMCDEIFPAPVDDQVSARARALAELTHRTLKLRDYSRVDFRVAPDGEMYCLEANTLPGLTPTSLLPQSARAAGVPFDELCERIVQAAAARGAGTKAGAEGINR